MGTSSNTSSRSSKRTNYLKLWHNDHWFWPFLKQNRVLLALIFALGTLTFICAAGLMFTSGFLISRSAREPFNIFVVYVPIVLTRAFGIGRPVFKYLERTRSHDWVLRVVSKLRVQLYRTLSKDASFLSEHERTGTVLSVLADDLEHLENFYLRTIFPTVVAYIMWVIVTIAVGVFSWAASLLLFVLFALILILIPLLSLAFSDGHYALEKSKKQDEYTQVTESYLGLSDWVITHREQEFAKIGQQEFDRIMDSQAQQQCFERWRDFNIQLIFAVMAVVLVVGCQIFMTGNQSIADYAAAVVLSLFPLVDCFIVVAQACAEVPLYSDSLQHLNALSERVDARQQEPGPQMSLGEPVQTIDIEDVTFAYGPGQVKLLDNVSLHITAGQKIALLGPSGEGKTTILQLLLGDLQPNQGRILVNGHPIASLQDERPQLFGYLNQQPFLFNTTIASNIRLGKPQASDSDIWQALKAVQMDEYVRSLPKGLDTPVQEGGARFSGGQRQRLALARIIVKNTPIILLDEPTIGLDPVTERQLMQMILSATEGRTLIWVTHHLQGLEEADQVVFLEDGHIAMQGSPAELYQNNPRFRQLYRLDVGDVNEGS
ncbi:thiol reductant ABC exporter subunit CydC [Bombiscardovia coagulans]|uniref:Cytochrome D ABC transporter ATP-binding and permease n=1 Tax=Bombiscardovia coagulans TaxID=686666 RepID=A0A261EV07_9BIFI|nr:thiol reductant ABC exporter subunit CydC [Bombiscardovia coagulans]OZG50701.1 cytochrome D ABC transporter ATP-binding and permease [Bombiscardovia coagulans]